MCISPADEQLDGFIQITQEKLLRIQAVAKLQPLEHA